MSDYIWFSAHTIAALQAEMRRAVEKHGLLNTPLACTDDSNIKVLAEEIGEVAELGVADPDLVRDLCARLGRVARFQTYDNKDRERLAAELLQTATMALAWHQKLAETPL
jgi:hypothetical protein